MRTAFLIICVLFSVPAAIGDETRLEFFEKKIRPVLVDHCYSCHAAESESLKGGLLLDTAAGSLHGGESGPAVVPGNPEDSLLVIALKYESFEMPPAGRLPNNVIADFEKWIRDGAVDPRTKASTGPNETESIDIEAGRNFWAFQVPKLSSSVPVGLADSRRIDFLVQRRLQKEGVSENEKADRRTLIRRVYFDLTGLPPTPEQVRAFVADESESAYSDVVEELLSSGTYGQRWARMWLDLARYAEDQAHIVGRNKSLFYPNAYLYRDWVINALNDDVPYDDFIRLQLAADLLKPVDQNQLAALGFVGLGPKYYRRNDPEVMAEEWEDRVDLVSRGLQGLTVACARCHDHKYDPVRTEDYYALAGVFASTDMHNQPLPSVKDPKSKDAKNPDNTMHVIRDGKVRDLKVMIRGKHDNLGDTVKRGFIEVVLPEPRRSFTSGSGRLELADAILDEKNPLTARVIVNRVWKEYFGRGIVGTPSNFGQLGDRPTHPELLDDLAVRFMENGWSLKWLHRQIVLSDSYQRSSDVSAAAMSVDPENKLLWRVSRRRLSIESWRDAVLLAAGSLDAKAGGKSIRPDDPEATRRTVYSAVSRFDLNPMLARFDFPDPNAHSAARSSTSTPLQKLFLLNSQFVLKSAAVLAERVIEETESVEEQVERLFQLTCQRSPSSEEIEAAVQLVTNSDSGLQQIAQSIIASNEFWYLD